MHANDGVTLCASAGTIHGLLGENGAGKSTLMKVLTGFISAGQRGDPAGRPGCDHNSPAEAVALGVGMLTRTRWTFRPCGAGQFSPRLPRPLFLDRRAARRDLLELAAQFDFQLDPDATISSLSVGERQQLEIVRLLWLGVRVLMLDEPTTAISAQQKAKLFAALRSLAGAGQDRHLRLSQAGGGRRVCHQVTVLARGGVTGEAEQPCPTDRLVRMMFGQSVTLRKRRACRSASRCSTWSA